MPTSTRDRTDVFAKLDLTVRAEVFGTVMDAFNEYTLGRMTYSPSIFQGMLYANADALRDPWAARIIGRTESRIADGYMGRLDGKRITGLGMDFDADDWLRSIRRFESMHAKVWQFADPDGTVTVKAEADDWLFAVGSSVRVCRDDISDDLLVEAASATGLNRKWATNILRDLDDDYNGGDDGRYPRLKEACGHTLSVIAENDYRTFADI